MPSLLIAGYEKKKKKKSLFEPNMDITRLTPNSGILQNHRPRRASQFHPEDLRRRHGKSDAQADTNGQEACAHESDGQSDDGRLGERSEGGAQAAFPR